MPPHVTLVTDLTTGNAFVAEWTQMDTTSIPKFNGKPGEPEECRFLETQPGTKSGICVMVRCPQTRGHNLYLRN